MAGPRLQAAMEYITTYGWAILIIALILAALFYLHVFNPSPSSACVLGAGISCTSLYLTQNGVLTFSLLQSTSTPINITAAGCNTNSTISNTIMTYVYNPPSNQFEVPIEGNYTMTIQCYSSGKAYSGSVGSLYQGYLILNYTKTNSNLPHSGYGSIDVKIS